MKSKVTYIPVLTAMLLVGACTTGSYVTGGYDDIYFSPGDARPILAAGQSGTGAAVSPYDDDAPLILSDPERNETHYFTTDDPDADAYYYDMEGMELVGSDTLYTEENGNTIINNYYEGDEIDFAYRINRFHRYPFYDPFFWDPLYYDPWYYPYYSWGYYDWYWPGSSFWFGYGGFSIGWSWGYPSYYSYYYPYHHHWDHHYFNNDNYHYGHRRSSYSTINTNGSYANRSGGTTLNGTGSRRSASGVSRQSTSRTPARNSETIMERRRTPAGGTTVSPSGRVSRSSNQVSVTEQATSGSAVRRSETISGTSNRQTAPAVRQSAGTRRSGSSITGTTNSGRRQSSVNTGSRSYVPSYSKPRTVTRPSYNNSQGSASGTSYQVPSRSRSSRTTTRSSYSSGTSYQRGSSRTTSRSYSIPAKSGSTYRSGSSSGQSRQTISRPAPSRSSGISSSPARSSGRSAGSSRGSGRR
ncbi:MAG: hypothetical protein AB7D05_04655 [Mangrovibacterium sp.]